MLKNRAAPHAEEKVVIKQGKRAKRVELDGSTSRKVTGRKLEKDIRSVTTQSGFLEDSYRFSCRVTHSGQYTECNRK